QRTEISASTPGNSRKLNTSRVRNTSREGFRRRNIDSPRRAAKRWKSTSTTWKRSFTPHGNPDPQSRILVSKTQRTPPWAIQGFSDVSGRNTHASRKDMRASGKDTPVSGKTRVLPEKTCLSLEKHACFRKRHACLWKN